MPFHFLVVDSDPAGQLLIGHTLKRTFRDAVITKSEDFITAVNLVNTYSYDAVVTHRGRGVDPESLVRGIRGASRDVPILALGIDPALRAAGATEFLKFEDWVTAGAVLGSMLVEKSRTNVQP